MVRQVGVLARLLLPKQQHVERYNVLLLPVPSTAEVRYGGVYLKSPAGYQIHKNSALQILTGYNTASATQFHNFLSFSKN